MDIADPGMTEKIKQIAKALDATLAFDEESHVHVEFKQGVLIGTPHAPEDFHDGRYLG